MKYPQARLLLLTKAPEPGKVKTRLGSHLGMEAAADIYEKLVHECLTTCVAAKLCPIDIWCDPSPDHPFFRHCSNQYETGLRQQVSGNLGLRMSQAVRSTLQFADHVVLIGADCPTLTAGDLDAALYALQEGSDVVLGPAEDGGYYLIGMSRYHPALFEDVPWSTRSVLEVTEKRLQQLQLKWLCLTERKDIDTIDDYAEYLKNVITVATTE